MSFRALRLLFFAFCITAGACPPGALAYKFVDDKGNEVFLPKEIPVFSKKKLGPWDKEIAGMHEAKVTAKFRYEGLEAVRYLSIEIPHPQDAEHGEIQKIYILDKDDFIVAYHRFNGPPKVRFRINGIINYIQILVYCSKHQGWRTEIPLKLRT